MGASFAGLEKVGVELIAAGVGKFNADLKSAETQYAKTLQVMGKPQQVGGSSAALNGVTDALSKMSGVLPQAASSTANFGKAASTLTGPLVGAAGTVGTLVSALGGPVGLVIGIGVAVIAAKGLWDAMKEIASAVAQAAAAVGNFLVQGAYMAGTFQEMELSALAVGRSMGLSREEITQAVGNINDLGIRYDIAARSVAQMTRNQLDLSRSTDLVRIAQGSAILKNMDSSEAMEDLIYGITTRNTRVLRTLGLMVDTTRAEELYAATLGKSAEQLTENESVQAVYNSVLERGAVLLDLYSAAMESPTKSLRSLTGRVIPELQAALMQSLMPAWATVIIAIMRFVESITAAVSEGGALYPILVNIGAGASLVADGFASALEYLSGFIGNFRAGVIGEMSNTSAEMLRFGFEIVANLAEGIVSATSTVLVAAMNAIGGVLSFWLAPGSPPKVAPDLGKWGTAWLASLLKGFTEGDFSLLEKIQGPLKQVLSGTEFSSISKQIAASIAGGGGISGDVYANITRAAGAFGAEIARLGRLQEQLAKSEDRVRDAELRSASARRRVTTLTEEYNAMLRAGAPQAQLDAKLKQINAQETAAESADKEAQAAKDGMEVLKDRIALQDKLIAKLIELSKASEDTKAGGDKAAAGVRGMASAVQELTDAMTGITPGTWDISTRISEAVDSAKAMLMERLAYIFQPLTDAWNNTIGPALGKDGLYGQFILFKDNVSRIGEEWWGNAEGVFLRFVDLLSIDVTGSMSGLSSEILTRFGPNLTHLGLVVKNDLLPFLQSLGNVELAIVHKGMEAIAVVIYDRLLPGIETFKTVMSTFGGILVKKFLPPFLDFIDLAINPLSTGLENIGKFLDTMTLSLQTFADVLNSLDISALLPFLGNSPSPLERGLTGIGRAMSELSAMRLPAFNTAISQMQPMPYSGGAGGGSFVTNSPNNSRSVVLNMGPTYIYGNADLARRNQEAVGAVRRELRRG